MSTGLPPGSPALNTSWFSVPLEVQARAWPTEDWQLVYSALPTVIPEDDLFAGLRPVAPDEPDPSALRVI